MMVPKRLILYLILLLPCLETFSQGHLEYGHKNVSYFPNENKLSDGPVIDPRLTDRINLRLLNVTVKLALDTVLSIFQYRLILVAATVYEIPDKISINVKNATLLDILAIIRQQVPIDYGFKGQHLIILRSQHTAVVSKPETPGEVSDSSKTLEEVYVNYYTDGHQDIPKEVATGSFAATSIIKYQQTNTSPNIVGRLEGIGFPVLLDNSDPLSGNTPVALRGLNSPFGNDKSRVILDGFIVQNSTDFINPFDIGNTNFLLDASSGGLYGTQAANGAIAFNTLEGINKGFEINVLSRSTLEIKPDLTYQQGWSASELLHFTNKVYNDYGASTLLYNSPVKQVLDRVAAGSLSQTDATGLFNEWGKNNLRKDIEKYFYRNALSQQYALNIRTGSARTKFYASGGLDKNEMPEKGNMWSRQTLTIKSSCTYSILTAQFAARYANLNSTSNYNPVSKSLSYWAVVDKHGNFQDMPFGDNADLQNANDQPGYLPLNYNPGKQQAFYNNQTDQKFYSMNGKLGLNLRKGLQVSYAFQLERAAYVNEINYLVGSYYANDLINKYRLVDSSGAVIWKIPVGSIRDMYTVDASTSQWRTEVKYSKHFGKWDIFSLGGFEKINHEVKSKGSREYAADLDYPQYKIDYGQDIPISISPGKTDEIPQLNRKKDTADHFFNYYASGYWTYDKKYTISGTVRTDLSNRFSNEINKFGVRLWSVGAKWAISSEKGYKSKWVTDLKLRSSYGLSGNINYSILPMSTFESVNDQNIIVKVHRPQSPGLTYEKLYMLNTGLEFEIKKGLLRAWMDYFQKKGTRLLNYISSNPTSGNSTLVDNSASTRSHGFDLNLQTEEIRLGRKFHYIADLNFLFTKNKVTSISWASDTKIAGDYTNPYTYTPRKGYPINSIFAFPSAGLDPRDGSPRGYLNKQISNDYLAIMQTTNGSTLQYIGSGTPTSMANLSNTIRFESFSLSCILTGKFGYYYRMQPLDYRRILLQQDDGIPGKRWENPGDETTTDIPSFQYPFDHSREDFANGRNTYVVRADHIRLQNIQLSYQFNERQASTLHVKSLKVFLSASNPGIIYRANKYKIDPDVAVDGYKIPTSFTFTLISTY